MIKSSEKNQNLNSSKTKPCFSAVGHQTTRCVYHWTSSKQLQKNISVSVLSSPEAEQHLSSKRFFLSFCFSFFIQCSPFRLFLCSSPSIALRLIRRRTMRQSGRQLFSVNSAMILALCISPLMLLNVTPSCCSALWAIKSNFIKSRSHSPLAEWSLCVCVCVKEEEKETSNSSLIALQTKYYRLLDFYCIQYFVNQPHFSFTSSLRGVVVLQRWLLTCWNRLPVDEMRLERMCTRKERRVVLRSELRETADGGRGEHGERSGRIIHADVAPSSMEGVDWSKETRNSKDKEINH